MFVWPVLAVVAILIAVRLLGARDRVRLSSAEVVRGVVADEHADISVADVSLGIDGTSALATTNQGPIAVVFVVGNQLTSRVVRSSDIRHVHEDLDGSNRRLTIDLHDLGCPRLAIVLSAEQSKVWWERLRALQATGLLQPH